MRKLPRTSTRRSAIALVIALALAAPLALSGVATAASSDSNQLTITAGEYAYEISGKPKPGWVEITFDNPGAEPHMVAVWRLKSGVTAKNLAKAFESDDEEAFADLIKGDGTPIFGTPGLLSSRQSTKTITKLKAGRYGVVCFVPDPDGMPHYAHGMIEVFGVKGSKSSFKPPRDGLLDVTLTDTAIELPTSGLPRSAWVKVVNRSSTPRDLILAKYAGATTFEQADAEYDAFFETGRFPSGSEPASLRGGLGPLAPGASGYFEAKLDGGRWVVVSSGEEDDDELHIDFSV